MEETQKLHAQIADLELQLKQQRSEIETLREEKRKLHETIKKIRAALPAEN